MLADPMEPLNTAVAAFANAKIAYTTRMTKLATDFNAGKPVTSADLNDLIISFYNPMTLASNALRAQIANLKKTAQTETQLFDTIFATFLNMLCGLQSHDQALDVITKLAADLENECATWFYYQTPTIDEANFSAERAFAAYKGETPVDHSQFAVTQP